MVDASWVIARAPVETSPSEGNSCGDEAVAVRAQEAGTAFASFYTEAFPRVYSYLFHRSGGNGSIAEDLTQETFLAVVARIKSHDELPLTMPWVITVARNKLVDYFRRHELEERKLSLVAGDESLTVSQHNEHRSRDDAMQALASLPASQRAALVLRYFDDLSVPDVAKALGRSVHATESLLARGRENFKRRYREASHD